jgi:hypothetical protein
LKTSVLIAVIISSLISTNNSWDFEKHEDGINAYSRIKDGTNYYEFRTTFTVKSQLDEVIGILTNVTNFENWLPNTKKSKILNRVNATTLYGYTVTETPWPLSDRDLVFKMTKTKLTDTRYQIRLEGEEHYYPEQSGKVRVKSYIAVWDIKKSTNGVLIDYTASFDPDSSSPYWMIKNSMINARIEVCQALKKELEK